MVEIERKFLVHSTEFLQQATSHYSIKQGYLSKHPDRTVRVRIKGDKGYLTIKGRGNATGMSRFEWEKEIPLQDAEQLFLLCESGTIDKTRYEIPFGDHIYEVDIFHGENEGLILAEIELSSETESFDKPEWLAAEVTNDERYYNGYLSQYPFKSW